jgi:hypothetical protein
MDSDTFEHLMSILEEMGAPFLLQEDWILCTDLDLLRDFPRMATRRKWLRKAKAEIQQRFIQERVDGIAEAVADDDEIVIGLLTAAFPEDLKLHTNLTDAQRQKWLRKAELAAATTKAVAQSPQHAKRGSVIYFISTHEDHDTIKIGYTTNLDSRLRSLRTSSPNEPKIHLVIPGSRDDEQNLHRQFAPFHVRREWFRRAQPINDFIARYRIV